LHIVFWVLERRWCKWKEVVYVWRCCLLCIFGYKILSSLCFPVNLLVLMAFDVRSCIGCLFSLEIYHDFLCLFIHSSNIGESMFRKWELLHSHVHPTPHTHQGVGIWVWKVGCECSIFLGKLSACWSHVPALFSSGLPILLFNRLVKK